MKKILLVITMAVLLLPSCDDSWLDTENVNNLDSGSFFKTESDLISAVNSAYTPLEHIGMFGLYYLKIFNTMDPYIWNETPLNSSFDQLTFQTSNAEIAAMWADLYRGLFRTSDILAKMHKVKDIVEPSKYSQYEAQLKALRGMYYFYLVTIFNEPIYYDETNVPTDPLFRFTNAEPIKFWNKLEEDLLFAASKLPESWESADDKGRIVKGGANALLGKARLFKHYHYYQRFGITTGQSENLDSAKVAFQRVINNPSHGLILPQAQDSANYQAALLCNFSSVDIPVGTHTYSAENNKEGLWEVQFNDDPGSNPALPGYLSGGSRLYEFFSPHSSSYRNHQIEPSFWLECENVSSSDPAYAAGYRKKDPRAYAACFLDGDMMDWREESGYKKAFVTGVNSKPNFVNEVYQYPSGVLASEKVPSGAVGLKKYYYPQHYTGRAPLAAPYNVRVIRYADVLLMYAEVCLLQGNTDASGLNALNDVRERAGMHPIDALTGDAIIHERDVELATEGHRYHDIIRWTFDNNEHFSVDLNTLFKGKFVHPKHLYLPIPLTEINSNKGTLKQNPGW